jgi:serine/threonine-protein kinase RsbW/stage II sporulation protein AB (anti-sigma F factor)
VARERLDKQALARPEEIAPLRTAVWRHALALGASAELGNAIRLAAGEALTNVVMHAYEGMEPGKMRIEAWLDDDEHLTVRILDEGNGLIPRTDSPGLGLGMGLMAQMADDFRVANREGTPGTTVSLRFALAEHQSETPRGGAAA